MKYFISILAIALTVIMITACHKKGKREGMERNGSKTNMHRMANKKNIGKKEGSILNIISHKPKLSMFVKLVKAAGADHLLQKGNNYKHYTLFAPSNKAFKALSEKERKKLTNPANKQELIKVLKYHIISGSVDSNDLNQNVNSIRTKRKPKSSIDTKALKRGKTYKTLNNGEKVVITKYKGQLMINGAKIIRKDIKARNGYIYIINKVLIPENHPH
jgi:uncharacterized surface protein with fasciclin (FAS1) repeats